jgi:hypothetical protein
MTPQSIEFDQRTDARPSRLALAASPSGSFRLSAPSADSFRQSRIAPTATKWFALRAGGVVNRRQQHQKA